MVLDSGFLFWATLYIEPLCPWSCSFRTKEAEISAVLIGRRPIYDPGRVVYV